MMRRFPFLIALMTLLIVSAGAQDARTDLLARINNLRQSLGLPSYTLQGALTAAAINHAQWLARTGERSHRQEDGSGPRTRAQNAGYSSSWVSENYYFGYRANPAVAWNWWLNSPAHYAGITSPNYNNIGIGAASSNNRNAYVLVFGNSSGRLLSSSAGAASPAADIAAPSYVVGIDELGNIMHEIQAGDTLGDIALIYGYTWAELPYMLEINGMTAADIRLLKPGSVFLVPPQDGSYTPSPANTVATSTAPAASPTAEDATQAAATATIEPSAPRATARIRIGALPQSVSTAARAPTLSRGNLPENLTLPILLAAAAVVQAGIIASALFGLVQRRL